MFANLITLAHFSVSSAISLPKSTGEPESGVPRLERGIGEAGVDLLVELVDDLGRGLIGRTNAHPQAGLVARNKLADDRNVRQCVRARCGRHRQRTQHARPDVPDRPRDWDKNHLYRPPSKSVSAGAAPR